ncbi:MAG: DUF805 domain-containing protein [Candidatus Taylorbacteria bacterium]|nr:DUF805 domain-containing protein [Candidatus Taylorbacteria bacterium]
MNYYLTVLKKYAAFNGRAQRKEFWYFVLFDSLIQLLLLFLLGKYTLSGQYYAPIWLANWPFWIYTLVSTVLSWLAGLFWIYILVSMIPRIAMFVRRMHDVGKSGWYLFIVLIPIYGVIRLLILLASDSKHGENAHPRVENNPKADNNKSGSGYCTKCGKKKDDDSKFCTNCGNKN